MSFASDILFWLSWLFRPFLENLVATLSCLTTFLALLCSLVFIKKPSRSDLLRLGCLPVYIHLRANNLNKIKQVSKVTIEIICLDSFTIALTCKNLISIFGCRLNIRPKMENLMTHYIPDVNKAHEVDDSLTQQSRELSTSWKHTPWLTSIHIPLTYKLDGYNAYVMSSLSTPTPPLVSGRPWSRTFIGYLITSIVLLHLWWRWRRSRILFGWKGHCVTRS